MKAVENIQGHSAIKENFKDRFAKSFSGFLMVQTIGPFSYFLGPKPSKPNRKSKANGSRPICYFGPKINQQNRWASTPWPKPKIQTKQLKSTFTNPNKYYCPHPKSKLNPIRLANQLKLLSHNYDLKSRINLSKKSHKICKQRIKLKRIKLV